MWKLLSQNFHCQTLCKCSHIVKHHNCNKKFIIFVTCVPTIIAASLEPENYLPFFCLTVHSRTIKNFPHWIALIFGVAIQNWFDFVSLCKWRDRKRSHFCNICTNLSDVILSSILTFGVYFFRQPFDFEHECCIQRRLKSFQNDKDKVCAFSTTFVGHHSNRR